MIKENRSGNSILITGGPRTGTTWVGKVLSQPRSVRYIHEPFNINAPLCHCRYKVENWFQYITEDNAAAACNHFKHIIGSPINYFRFRNSLREAWRAKRLRAISDLAGSFFTKRAVIKDPLSVFSAEWLASTFNLSVIVLIRHPAAFAYSYKKCNWSNDFNHFLNQPNLMKDRLYPFTQEVERFAFNEFEIIEQAALLWKLIYHVVNQYRQTQPDWVFIRHEDIAQNPVEQIRGIFHKMGLDFSENVVKCIEQSSSSQHPVESGDLYSIQRNSKRISGIWKSKLSSFEVLKIREIVGETSCMFYSDEEWLRQRKVLQQ